MATLITQDSLRSLVEKGVVIEGGDLACAEGVKYDFRIGGRFLKASWERPVTYQELSVTDRANAKVSPGEVVFVMSEEKLQLPPDMFLILSQKRKISHEGITVMGGLCVDPLYEGHLLVGLYNFSSSDYPINPGRKLIAGIFYKLEKSELSEINTAPVKIFDFPDDLVKLIKSYQPINVQSLIEQMQSLRSDLDLIRQELHDDRQWKKEFKDGLDGLLEALKEERENRESQYGKVRDRIHSAEEKISEIDKSSLINRTRSEFGIVIVILLVGAVIGAIIRSFL